MLMYYFNTASYRPLACFMAEYNDSQKKRCCKQTTIPIGCTPTQVANNIVSFHVNSDDPGEDGITLGSGNNSL